MAAVHALVPVLPENPHLGLGWPRNLGDLRSIGGDSTHAEDADLGREVLGDPKEGAGARRLGQGLDDRVALVRGRADVRRERDPARRRESPGAAAAEDLLTLAAVPALEAAHVLDQPQDRSTELGEHGHRLLGDVEGEILRRRDDRRAGEVDPLAEAQLDIPGTRRQIDEQVVELAPVNAAEELVDHLREHRSPPDGRLSSRHEEAHRHDSDAVAEDGNDRPLLRCQRSGGAHNGGNARPVHIGVHQAHPGAQFCQRNREIRAHGRLPDTALPARDRNDVLDQRDQLVLLLRLEATHLRGHHDRDVRDARDREDRPLRVLLHLVANRTGWSGELDREGNVLAVDLKVLDEAKRDDVPAQIRVGDLRESRNDRFRRDWRLSPLPHGHLADVSTWRWSRGRKWRHRFRSENLLRRASAPTARARPPISATTPCRQRWGASLRLARFERLVPPSCSRAYPSTRALIWSASGWAYSIVTNGSHLSGRASSGRSPRPGIRARRRRSRSSSDASVTRAAGRARAASESLLDRVQALDEAVDLLGDRVEVEARPVGGGDAEPGHQRLTAVVPGADRDALPVEDLRH